jgi:hypothetical protein
MIASIYTIFQMDMLIIKISILFLLKFQIFL